MWLRGYISGARKDSRGGHHEADKVLREVGIVISIMGGDEVSGRKGASLDDVGRPAEVYVATVRADFNRSG